jgi:hypothetical protein
VHVNCLVLASALCFSCLCCARSCILWVSRLASFVHCLYLEHIMRDCTGAFLLVFSSLSDIGMVLLKFH